MNLALFYGYRIISRLYFHLPILFVFFYLNQIDIISIEILLAAYGITISVTSQWSGPLVRRMPHKWVIALGEVLKAVGLLMMIYFRQFESLLAAQIIGGLGYSLAQGTDSSLLRSMHGDDEIDAYRRHESNTAAWIFAAVLVAGTLGSILFRFDQAYPFYAAAVAALLAGLFIILIAEDPKAHQSVTTGQVSNTAGTVRLSLNGTQKYWMSYYMLVRAFALASFVGFLPYLFFLILKIDMYFFGLVLSLFNLAAYISARYAVRVMAVVGARTMTLSVVFLALVTLVLFATLSEHTWAGLVAISALGLATGGIRPVTMSNLNRLPMASAERTAMLSMMERGYGILNAVILLVGGWVLAAHGFETLMISVATIFAFMFAIFAIAGFRIRWANDRPVNAQPS